MNLALANCSWGRVLLHLACAVSRPSHLRWHLRGICRECAVWRGDATRVMRPNHRDPKQELLSTLSLPSLNPRRLPRSSGNGTHTKPGAERWLRPACSALAEARVFMSIPAQRPKMGGMTFVTLHNTGCGPALIHSVDQKSSRTFSHFVPNSRIVQ